jgi:tetratricopeptide (TPR) repeat protein
MSKAEAAAKQALEIDDTLPEAHASLGVINMRYHWRWQEAESRLQRAIALDPDYAPAHFWYSNLLTITGRRQEAVSQAEVAKDLDPFSPAATMNHCRAIYFARQYDRAAACFDKLIEEHPDYTHGKYARGYVYLQKGMYREAVGVFEELYAADKSLAGAALGYAYGVTGRRDDALRVISEMQELSKSVHIPPQEIALVHFGLGDLDRTYLLLEQAAEQHFASFVYIAADPMFRRLHSDQKFIDLLRRFNLPLPQPEG